MFNQAGLCVMPRGGKKHNPLNFYSKQLDEWESDPLGLWRRLKARQRPPSRKVRNGALPRSKAAIAVARRGEASRAMGSLESGALAPVDNKTLEALKSKHPQLCAPLPVFAPTDLPEADSFDCKVVRVSALSLRRVAVSESNDSKTY